MGNCILKEVNIISNIEFIRIKLCFVCDIGNSGFKYVEVSRNTSLQRTLRASLVLL